MNTKGDTGTHRFRSAALQPHRVYGKICWPRPVADLGRRLSGQPGARHGIATWRMSADLGTAALIEEDQSKPTHRTTMEHYYL